MVKVKKWSRRVVWMVAIWCASVLLLAGVGMLFRLLMTSAGFRSWLIPPDALSSLAKARFYRQIGVYRSPLLALSLPSIAVDNYSHLYCRSRAAVIWLHSG